MFFLRLKALIFAGIAGTFLCSGGVLASNFHEHYTSLVSFKDYVTAFRKAGMPLESVKLRALSESPNAAISHIFGSEVLKALPLEPTLAQLTLKEASTRIADTLGSSVDETMRAFFEFNRLNKRTVWALETIGWDIRSNAQKILGNTPGGLETLFGSYFDRTPLAERRVLALSISANTFFDSRRLESMRSLKALFRSRGTTPEFFLVMQRTRLIEWADADFEKFLSDFEAAAKTGVVDGFDLVGSLHEASSRQMNLPEEVQKRLKQRFFRLFETMTAPGNRHLHFKLHGWEAPSDASLFVDGRKPIDGDFYKVFWEAMAEIGSGKAGVRLPNVFRIGHISGLGDKEIALFDAARKDTGTRFVFEANIASNTGIHPITSDAVIRTIGKLDAAGFTVVLGTDGEGILGRHARYTATLALLKPLISRSAYRSIKRRSMGRFEFCAWALTQP